MAPNDTMNMSSLNFSMPQNDTMNISPSNCSMPQCDTMNVSSLKLSIPPNDIMNMSSLNFNMPPNDTMNMSSHTGIIPSLEDLDQLLYDKPTVAFVAVLAILGTIGNIHTLLVYTMSSELNKLPVRVLITWLAATDLVACAVCMPFEIFDIRFANTFNSRGACKFFRFLTFAIAYSSGGFLTTIAIQRFKINSRQNYQKNGKPGYLIHGVAIGVTVVSIFFGTPGLVCYDAVTEELIDYPGLNGTDCKLLAGYQDSTPLSVFVVFMLLVSTCCFVVVVVLYSIILYTLYSHIDNNKIVQSKEGPEKGKDTSNASSVAQKMDNRCIYERGRQLTITLIVASAVSYIGYVLYEAQIVFYLANPTEYQYTRYPTWLKILSRSCFINNAVNPVVYCLLDRKFRKECLKLYKNKIGGSKLNET